MVVHIGSIAARFSAVSLLLIAAAPSLSAAGIVKYNRPAPAAGYLIRNVPFEPWLERNCCGPACLSMVLDYWAPERAFDQRAIAAEIYNPSLRASFNSEMVLYPRSRGFASFSFQGSLETLRAVLKKDIPVIVLTKRRPRTPIGHYRVVIGFDEAQNQIIFHDPFLGAGRAMDVKDFLKIWDLDQGPNLSSWMMAIVPEQMEFPFPALLEHPLTHINLATAYYRKGDYEMSKVEWEKVRETAPEDPFPLYSLGMISLRQGRFEEAESLALEALKLDGKNAYAEDVLGLACAKQERVTEAFQALGRAVRLAPKEGFIRNHYLQVRAIYIENAGRTEQE